MRPKRARQSPLAAALEPPRTGTEEHDATHPQPDPDALTKSEELFQASFAHAAVGLAITDLEGHFLEVNKAYCSITGCSEAELRSLDFQSIMHPNDLPKARERMRALLDGEIPAFVIEKRYIRKDGNIVWVKNSVSLIRDDQGRPAAFVRLIQDITERKQAEQATKTVPTILLAASGALLALTTLGVLEHFLERSVMEAVALSVPVIFGSLAAAGITYFALRRQEVLYRRAFEEITERKLAENALHEAERKYGSIFENAVEGIFQTTPAGRFITANPALASMLGFESPEELIKSCTDIAQEHYVDPQKREEFKRLLERHGSVRGFEQEVYRKDGSRIWISDNVRAVRDESGVVLYFEGTAQDITERKHAEAALRESEERYRDLVENSRELICTHDLNGIVLSVNRAAVELFGYDPNKFLGKRNIRDILAPEVRDQFDDYMARILEEKETSGLMLVQTRSGERRMLEYYNSLRTNGVAKPIVRGIARDITERRRAEKALRESEERYRELFENSKDAIFVHDLREQYTSANRAAEKLSGYTREEILGKNLAALITAESLEQFRERFYERLKNEGETTYEAEVIAKHGGIVPVEVSSRLIYEDGVPVGVQGSARDITERKRAQEAQQNYSRRLIEVQEAERESIARELHDEIGQVLTAVRINLESIGRLCGSVPDALAHIEEGLVIVDEALGRVRELSLELRPSLLDDLGLTAALRWYLDRYRQRTGLRAKLFSDVEYGNRLPREIESTCFRVAQEALTNVVRHAQATHVSVRLKRTKDEFQLVIRDNGVGFDAESLLRNAASTSALGLRGIKERALAVRGSIEINSALGRGTEIRARFPPKAER